MRPGWVGWVAVGRAVGAWVGTVVGVAVGIMGVVAATVGGGDGSLVGRVAVCSVAGRQAVNRQSSHKTKMERGADI